MHDSALDISERLAALVARTGPSLARVEAGRRPVATGIVWAPGVVVTPQHALDGESELTVGLDDGRTVNATLAGRDPAVDLAVLRVEAQDLTPAAFGEPAALQVGHLVLAAARPGRSVRAALGVVSALGESYRTHQGGRVERYIEAALPLPPGFSGALLLSAAGDEAGAGLGLLSPALVRGAQVALPLVTLRRVVGQLLERGRIDRGFLGVVTTPGELPSGLSGTLGQRSALLVVSIAAGSPAEQAGLLLGDALVALAGRPVRQVRDLIELLDEAPIGAEAQVRIVRAGELQELPVRIGARN